jgi:xylonate dehydratase
MTFDSVPRIKSHRTSHHNADESLPYDRVHGIDELVEVLYGYPLDGVVLTTGCDKTTPAAIMAAATVNIPAIVLSGGPMLNGWWRGERAGSGTVVWWARQELAAGRMDYKEFLDLVA